MSESVYKIIELVGSSPVSWEDAAKNAVERASKTLRDLRIAEVTTLDMIIYSTPVFCYISKIIIDGELKVMAQCFWFIEQERE